MKYFAAMLLIVFAESCKKGEEDPWLSLRSRSQRVTGTWNMAEKNSTTTVSDEGISTGGNYNNNYEKTIVYDGKHEVTTEAVTRNVDDNPVTTTTITTIEKTVEITINKDGTYAINTIEVPVTTEMITTGEKNECGETGIAGFDCDGVYHHTNEIITNSDEGRWWWEDGYKKKTYLVLGDDYDAWYLKKLSHKEMITVEDINGTDQFRDENQLSGNLAVDIKTMVTWIKEK